MTDQAVAARLAPRELFQTIYSGMEVETFLNDPGNRSAIRAAHQIPDDAIVLVKVARLFEFKGHDDVLDAIKLLFDDQSLEPALQHARDKVHVLFVGGGIWRDRLQAKVNQLGLADRIHFAGLVPSPRIPEFLHASDIVIHASYREGLARVLPQGLLSGKPVISYDVDGAREVVITDQTGVLVPFRDTHGLKRAVLTLLADPNRRTQLGAAGRALCRERFDHLAMTAAIRQVYQDVLARKISPIK